MPQSGVVAGESEDPLQLLTYRDVARRLQCCEKHVREKYVQRGLLAVVRLGSRVRFRPSDVEKLIGRLMGDDPKGTPA